MGISNGKKSRTEHCWEYDFLASNETSFVSIETLLLKGGVKMFKSGK
jgi:hypothetical protein